MIEHDLIFLPVHPNLNLVADCCELLFIIRHLFMNGLWNARLDRQLEGVSPPHPQQFFKVPAPFQHRICDLTAISHQIPKQGDHIQKRRFAAGIRTHQSDESAQLLVDGP